MLGHPLEVAIYGYNGKNIMSRHEPLNDEYILNYLAVVPAPVPAGVPYLGLCETKRGKVYYTHRSDP